MIGTLMGGVGIAPLMIDFTTADATPAAASALLRQIAYRNTNIEDRSRRAQRRVPGVRRRWRPQRPLD